MMRHFAFAGGVALAVLAVVAVRAQDAPDPAKPADASAAEGLLIKRSELLQKPPTADLGPARAWVVEKGKDVQSLLVEIDGTIPLHVHPDGVHRMYLIKGKIRVTLGSRTMDMEPGDYIMIPRGVRHKLERLGEGKAVYATVDTPPVDPAKIVWMEPPPKKE